MDRTEPSWYETKCCSQRVYLKFTDPMVILFSVTSHCNCMNCLRFG